ncbi:MAG: hypothetical protein CMK09_08280 [Ponticaulis sp.]|nr:hypothetical protein [Ponticaulis sp.]
MSDVTSKQSVLAIACLSFGVLGSCDRREERIERLDTLKNAVVEQVEGELNPPTNKKSDTSDSNSPET